VLTALGRPISALLLLATVAFAAPSQTPDLVGSWRGTSICVDKEHFPACNDEQVIYDATAIPGARDSVTLRADKIVNGARDFMGEFTFGRHADSTWIGEWHGPRTSVRITLRVTGTHLNGTLVDGASGRTVRRLTLERVPPTR